MSDELDDLPPPNVAAGYERRLGMQANLIRELKGRIEVSEARAATAEAQATELTGKFDTQAEAHTTAIDAMQGEHAGVLSRMERMQALTAAGVDAEGHDVVLSAYTALGEGAPKLAEWLKGEDLPKHVSVYIGSTNTQHTTHNPDAGTGGRAGTAAPSQPGFLKTATIDDLRAMKEQGLLG